MKKRKILLGLALAGICAINLASCADNSQKTTKPNTSEIDVVKEKINFIVEGKVYQSITIENGKVTMPENPTKEGYNFKGWYTDETYQTEFVNSNITTGANVYALFTQITVERFVDGESLGEVAFNNLDDNISAKEGLTLDKWYIDEACTTKYTNQDVDKLYARNMAKLTLNNGYEDFYTILLKPNTAFGADKLADVEIPFYMDSESVKYVDEKNNTFDFDSTISKNTTVKTIWATPGLMYQYNSETNSLYTYTINTRDYTLDFYKSLPVVSFPSTAKYIVDGEEKELPLLSVKCKDFVACSTKMVIFNEGIKEIMGCCGGQIEEVVLPESLEIISEAFNTLPNLKGIDIPSNVKAIYDSFWNVENMYLKSPNLYLSYDRDAMYDFEITIPKSVISMSQVPTNLKFEEGSSFFVEDCAVYQNTANGLVLVYDTNMTDGTVKVKEGVVGINSGAFTHIKSLEYLYLPSTFSFVNLNLDITNYPYARSYYMYDEAALSSTTYKNSYSYSIVDTLESMGAVIVNQKAFDENINDKVIVGYVLSNYNYFSYNDDSKNTIKDKVYFIGELDSEGDTCNASNIYLGTEPYGPGYVVYTQVQDGEKFINGNNYYTGEYPYTEANIQKGDYISGDYYERSEVYSYVLTQDKYSTNRNKYYKYNSETNTYTRVRINVGTDLSDRGDLYEISYSLTTDTVYRYNAVYMVKQAVYKAATVTVGDAVQENTYYELNDNVYSLTTDTTFEEGKTYYLYSGTNYVNASYNVGDEITGEVYSPSYEYTKTEDTIFSNSKAYYVLLTDNKYYYSQAKVTVGDTVTSDKYYVLNDNNEYVLTTDETFVEGTTYYVKSTFVAGEYVMAEDINRGDSPTGLYELIDNEYVLTTDTIAINGKTYYQRGKMQYTLIENVNGVDAANITIFYTNKTIDSKETFKTTVIAGEKITRAELIDLCGIDESSMTVNFITELKESYNFDNIITRNLYIEIEAEYSTTGFTYEVVNGEAVVTGFDEDTASKDEATGLYVVIISSEIDGYEVTSIADEAFMGLDCVERFIIASSIKSIGKYAFKNTTNLEYISVSEGGLEEIKEGAFLDSSITKISIPLANIKNIEPYAFKTQSLVGFVPTANEQNRTVANVYIDFATFTIPFECDAIVDQYYYSINFMSTSNTEGLYFSILKYTGETTLEVAKSKGSEEKVTVPALDVQLIAIAAGFKKQAGTLFGIGFSARKNGGIYPNNVIRYEVMEGSYYYAEAPQLGIVSKIHENAFTDMDYIKYVYEADPSYGQYDCFLDVELVKAMDSSIFEAGWFNGITEGEDLETLKEKMQEVRTTETMLC